ncbi:hydroxypyruvate isomerase family protein [Frigidibacter sp. ROC022]|uniref:hydroxypyruvate isomerase family protein n=1 Tax=Frigidibacter sp. ROC022 TaxID=2971796 RepID=UPI00215A5C98|nr:TIM barrel protein [Frigidibacter sp. ROC022]MCR8722785.1 TIM barrel protein [Frigidibacter sp. ROC022]
MPRFAANLTMLYPEFPFLERFDEARADGFEAVEILFPYDDPVKEITERLTRLGLPLVLINAPPPNWAGGERGFAAVPGREERFRSDFRRALRFARAMKPQHIHIMAGVAEGPAARATFADNLAWAAAEAPRQSLTIEPLNPIDMPGYFLNDFGQAADLLDEIDAPNLGLQFDAYHARIITGDVPAAWDRWGRLARHVQIAGTPGRHEPVKGEIDYPAFFDRLDSDGYTGWVSAEYRPAKRTSEGLGWLKPFRR